jgi:hypothetical protein
MCSAIRPQTPRIRNHASTYDDSVCPTCLSILSRVFKVSRVHALPGSENLKEFFAPLHPRYLPPFPMNINYSFTCENQPDMFKNIVFNKRKARGHLPLKCINMRILWDLINFFCTHFEFAKSVLLFWFFKGIIIVTMQYCNTTLPSTNVSSIEVLM